jgi:hypothetical protein
MNNNTISVISVNARGLCSPDAFVKLTHAINTLKSQGIEPSHLSIQETNFDKPAPTLTINTHNNIQAYKLLPIYYNKRDVVHNPNAKGGIATYYNPIWRTHSLYRTEHYVVTLSNLNPQTVRIHTTIYISPSLNAADTTKVYEQLTHDINAAKQHNRNSTIVLTFTGDFNACLGSNQWSTNPVHLRHGNASGGAHLNCLKTLCSTLDLWVASGLQGTTHTRSYTENNELHAGNEIDYILASNNLQPCLHNASTENGTGVLQNSTIYNTLLEQTDHHLLWAGFKIDDLSPQKKVLMRKKHRLDYTTLKHNKKARTAFQSYLKEHAPDMCAGNPSERHTAIKTHLTNAAKAAGLKRKPPAVSSLPKKARHRATQLHEKKLHHTRKLHKALKNKHTKAIRSHSEKLRDASIKLKHLKDANALNSIAHKPGNAQTFRNIREVLFFDEMASDQTDSEITSLLSDNNEMLYSKEAISAAIKDYFDSTQHVDPQDQRFDAEHYRQTLENVNARLTSDNPPDTHNDILQTAITLDETTDTIAVLPFGSEAGIDEIPYEALMHGGESLAKTLTELMVEIQTCLMLPTEWKEGLIVLLHKKRL